MQMLGYDDDDVYSYVEEDADDHDDDEIIQFLL